MEFSFFNLYLKKFVFTVKQIVFLYKYLISFKFDTFFFHFFFVCVFFQFGKCFCSEKLFYLHWGLSWCSASGPWTEVNSMCTSHCLYDMLQYFFNTEYIMVLHTVLYLFVLLCTHNNNTEQFIKRIYENKSLSTLRYLDRAMEPWLQMPACTIQT